jgi:hypothetical protein
MKLATAMGLAVCAVVSITPQISAQDRPDGLLTQYCKQSDRNPWFCGRSLPESQRWYVLAGYCTNHPTPKARPIGTLPPDPNGTAVTPDELCANLLAVEPLSLAFDRRAQKWDEAHIKEILTTHGRAFDTDDATGVPVAKLKANDRIGIVVTHANPMVNSATRGAPKQDDAEQFAAVPQLLAALGPAVSTVVGAFAGLLSQPPSNSALLAMSSGRAVVMNFDFATADELSRDIALVESSAQHIANGAKSVKARLAAFAALRNELQTLAQGLEHGQTVFHGRFDQSLESERAWADSFRELSEGLNASVSYASCEASLDLVSTIVGGEKPAEVEVAAINFARLLKQVDSDGAFKCKLEYPREVLVPRVAAVERAAHQAAIDPEIVDANGIKMITLLRQQQADARSGYLAEAMTLRASLGQLTTRRDAAEQVLKKEEETRKAAGALSVMATRARDSGFRIDEHGNLIVSDMIFVTDETYTGGFTKVRTTPLVITRGSPYADQVIASGPQELTTSYKLARYGADRVTVTAGPIYTKVSSPTYTAIDIDPSSNTEVSSASSATESGVTTTTTVKKPELKRVVEKDRDPRAGTLGIFLNYRVIGTQAFGVGGQFGVGVSKDFPSFHYGLGINASKWFTAGLGCGAFRVKALGLNASGVQQQIDDPVSGDGDIRLTNAWRKKCFGDGADAYYGMISVNLLGLPLFSGK